MEIRERGAGYAGERGVAHASHNLHSGGGHPIACSLRASLSRERSLQSSRMQGAHWLSVPLALDPVFAREDLSNETGGVSLPGGRERPGRHSRRRATSCSSGRAVRCVRTGTCGGGRPRCGDSRTPTNSVESWSMVAYNQYHSVPPWTAVSSTAPADKRLRSAHTRKRATGTSHERQRGTDR